MRRLLAVLLFTFVWANHAHAAKEKGETKLDERTVQAILVSAVQPEYPYEARLHHITGSGVAVLWVDRAAGTVYSCQMVQSTDSDLLDEAALRAFRQWCFKPGTVAGVKIPITFIMPEQSVRLFTDYHVKEKSMDDALAGFLSKGTVEKGPSPAYPHSVPWTKKQGKGVYEIHVRKDGTVSDVKILHQSGDEIFDRTVVDTLRKWRLRRGPLIVELPLAFNLTPIHYSVFIPKGR